MEQAPAPKAPEAPKAPAPKAPEAPKAPAPKAPEAPKAPAPKAPKKKATFDEAFKKNSGGLVIKTPADAAYEAANKGE